MSGFSILSFSQEITQENFDKEISEIWSKSEQQIQAMNEMFNENPEKKDSLTVEIQKQTYQKMFRVSVKYMRLPNTLEFIYNIRNNVSKDSLLNAINSLPPELQHSEYTALIRAHIDTEQVKVGAEFSDFEAIGLNGEKFKLSSLQGRNILFLYGGLGCMGKNGRDYLKNLYNSTSRDEFDVVIYCPVESMDKLRKEDEIFSTNYILISDFLLDHSPIKIKYGTQATPTCFFINKDGIIQLISIGLPIDYLNKTLKY